MIFDSLLIPTFEACLSWKNPVEFNYRKIFAKRGRNFFFHFDQIKKLDVDTHKESQAFDVSSWFAFFAAANFL